MTRRDTRPLDQPHPDRFPTDSPSYDLTLQVHQEAMERGDSGYIDPVTGYFVFTAAYLAARDCCACGCRHCPYVAS